MDDILLRMMQLAQKGYVCSQIILQLGLDLRGENNLALIRAMAGPAYGCGTGRATCGALIGGVSLLALYAAKGAGEETEADALGVMIQELSDWFSEHVGGHHGGITCEAITGAEGPGRNRPQCGGIVADTFSQAVALLTENGFDLAG